MLRKPWRIVHRIYENAATEPTVVHHFYGATADEAQGVYLAHMQTDAFLRFCVEDGHFHDIPCTTAATLEQWSPRGWRMMG